MPNSVLLELPKQTRRISVKQNSTAKQCEEELGQYERLLRLHAWSFRDFMTGTSTSDGKFQENGECGEREISRVS